MHFDEDYDDQIQEQESIDFSQFSINKILAICQAPLKPSRFICPRDVECFFSDNGLLCFDEVLKLIETNIQGDGCKKVHLKVCTFSLGYASNEQIRDLNEALRRKDKYGATALL